ncbi:DUF1080 domain-containing protein [Aquirufa sp. ROCK-SH2]
MKTIKITLLLGAGLLFGNPNSLLAQAQKSNTPVYVNDAERSSRVQANLKIIQESNDIAQQQRAMQALQSIGQAESVDVIVPFLKNSYLAGPAARTLSKLYPYSKDKVANALLGALESNEASTKIHAIQALTDIQLSAASSKIQALYPQTDSRVNQVILKALYKLGQNASASLLAQEAKKVNFSFDPAHATDAYVEFLKAAKDTKSLQAILTNKDAKLDDALTTKILSSIANLSANPTVEFLKIYSNSNLEIGLSALKKYLKIGGKKDILALAQSFKTWNEEKKSKFVEFAALQKATWTLDFLNNVTGSVALNSQVVKSLLILQKENAVVKVWNMAARQDLDAMMVGSALVTVNANDFLSAQLKNYANLSASQKSLALIYASARQWPSVKTEVWKAVQSNDKTRAAAYSVLPKWVDSNDFEIIAEKLSITSEPEELKCLHACMVQILKTPGSSSKITAYAKKSKQPLNWIPYVKEVDALDWLYSVAKKTSNEDAIAALVNVNAKSFQNPTQQVLRFRNALDLTKNLETRETIYKLLAKNNTLSSMRVLYKGLKEQGMKQTAAESLLAVYTANPDFQSAMTKEWLQEALPAITNPEKRAEAQKVLSSTSPARGFYSMFNGVDLTGWKGLVANPVKRRLMSKDTLALLQKKADEIMRTGWYVKNDELHFTGHGENLCSVKDYQDFDMYVDWKIEKDGDAGIYLRGSPQVQVWDLARVNVGANVGSGGLYNNQINPSKPLKVADNPIDEWNSFHIIMRGERVTVYLNGEKVVDNTILENYWDRKNPIFPMDAIELQAHGNHITYRNIYVKELEPQKAYTVSEEEKQAGFEPLFDGSSLFNWTGNTVDYVPENGELAIYPSRGGKGNLYTKKEYGDFHMKFDFQLTPGANNGLGIRAPLEGDAAYKGMELQILDNTAPVYANLQPYQYHGSVYGIIAAKQGFLKPVGEWNQEEVIAEGNHIKVILNGEVILDGDIAEATKNGTPDHKEHPGLFNKTGHIGFLGHGSELRFRNLRIKEIVPNTKKKRK